MADRVLDVRLDEATDKGVARPGRVGSHEDVVADKARIVTRLVAHLVVARQAGDHLVQQLEVILGVVGAGVARAELAASGSPSCRTRRRSGRKP